MGWGFIAHHVASGYIPVRVVLTIQDRILHTLFPVGLCNGEM